MCLTIQRPNVNTSPTLVFLFRQWPPRSQFLVLTAALKNSIATSLLTSKGHRASDNQDDDNCSSSRGGGGKYTTIAPKSPCVSVDDDTKDCGPHSPPDRMTGLILDEDDNNPGGRYDDANESVHYHNHFDEYSCHGRIDHISFLGKCSQSSCSSDWCPPSWVHIFSKSSHPSSLRTKAACIAHIEQPVHKKARHRQNRGSKKFK